MYEPGGQEPSSARTARRGLREDETRPNVRFGLKADIGLASIDVRFTPESGHSTDRVFGRRSLPRIQRPGKSACERTVLKSC
jgi:hypothetical protein